MIITKLNCKLKYRIVKTFNLRGFLGVGGPFKRFMSFNKVTAYAADLAINTAVK